MNVFLWERVWDHCTTVLLCRGRGVTTHYMPGAYTFSKHLLGTSKIPGAALGWRKIYNPHPQGTCSLVQQQNQQTGNDNVVWQVLLEQQIQGTHEGAAVGVRGEMSWKLRPEDSGYKPGEEKYKRGKQCLQKPKWDRELEEEGTANLGIIKVYRVKTRTQ